MNRNMRVSNYGLAAVLAVVMCVGQAALGEGVEIGKAAPDFTLKSADGKDVSLKDFKGKIVVLEWTNPDCPFVKRHHVDKKTTQALTKEWTGKNVVWLAIDSNKHITPEMAAKHTKEHGITYPILMDKDGKIGKAYGAATTPHMFVIDAKGNLAYMGAIDDDPRGDNKTPTNYVKQAVDSLLAGSTVATPTTKSYGCSVKYAE